MRRLVTRVWRGAARRLAPAPAPVPSDRPPPPSAEQLLLADYAALARRLDRRALRATLSRTRSRPAREILAHLVSGGRLDLGGILSTFEEFRDPALRPRALTVLRTLNRSWLAELGRMLVVQQASAQDALDACTAFEVLIARGRAIDASAEFRPFYAEALVAAGRRSEARALLGGRSAPTGTELRILADAQNPNAAGGAPIAEWLATLNREWSEAGLEAATLDDGDAPPIDRLRSEAAGRDGGPLVTVVITSFRPGIDLMTSVRSVLASSWRNLEVVVVDDASGSDYAPILAAVAALDERVRLMTLPTNGGTYRARNAALVAARGELLTFQDADDWMHPRRIEAQVEHLLRHPDLPANASRSVRVTDDLRFCHGRSPDAKGCEPSLLIRRDLVMQRVGFFDATRKGADVEYRERISAAFGTKVPYIPGPPLTWQRARAGSLSADDIGREWLSGPRRAYRSAFGRWHRKIAAGEADPYVAADGEASRPFFAPAELGDAPPRHYDVVFLSSWLVAGSTGGSQRSNAEEARALADAGYRVAIANVEAFWFMNWRPSSSRLSDRALDLLENHGVGFVALDSDVTVDLVVVRYPPVLQFLDPARSRWTPRRVLVVGNQAPYEHDGSQRRYDVATASSRVGDVFGREPLWVPQGPVIRDLYERLVPPAQLADFDLPPIVDPEEFRVDRPPRAGRRAVVGRYSRDAEAKWPVDAAEILAVYGSPRYDTLIMGGPQTLSTVVGAEDTWPRTWEVIPTGAMPVREFLGRIDFFVYFPHPQMREAYGRSIVEALVSGAVAILPRVFEPVFGAAAVYADPHQVEDAVMALYDDDAAFERQVAAGRAFGARVGRDAYLHRITPLIEATG